MEDGAARCPHSPLRCEADQPERPEHVRLPDHGLTIFLSKRQVTVSCPAVHKDVDNPELVRTRAPHRLAARGGFDCSRDRKGASGEALDLLDERSTVGTTLRVDCDGGSGPREAQRNGPADTPG